MRRDPEWCDKVRGYHGPFTDQERFIGAEPPFADNGTCAECGSTLHVPTEEKRREIVLAYQERDEQEAA